MLAAGRQQAVGLLLSLGCGGDKLRDQVMREAQRLVAQAARSDEYLSQSKTAAEAIIAEVYCEVGWSVEVRWAEGGGTAAAEAR